MTEEKKEEVQKQAEAPQAPVVPTPPSAEAAAPTTPAPGEQAPAPAAKEEKKAEVKREKPSNCAGCNKSIKKKRWYYRNGKFYCTHRCWKSALKKEAKPEAAKT